MLTRYSREGEVEEGRKEERERGRESERQREVRRTGKWNARDNRVRAVSSCQWNGKGMLETRMALHTHATRALVSVDAIHNLYLSIYADASLAL